MNPGPENQCLLGMGWDGKFGTGFSLILSVNNFIIFKIFNPLTGCQYAHKIQNKSPI